MTHPFVSVVSISHNRRARVANLLTALRRQTYPSFEVIVVDNASSDGTSSFIRSEFPEVRLIESPENLANYSYNLGVHAAKGKYILMMDDDGLPARRDWIARMVACFETNPRLGAVACTVRMQDTGRLAQDSPQFAPEGDADSGYLSPAYNGTGAGLRAAAIQEVGALYPEHFFISCVELHLCTRLLEAGWEVRLFPNLEVWHCRPSGSSYHPTNYYGLRNYFWYVLEFYPWPYVFTEILHEFGRCTKATLQGQVPFTRFLQAMKDTCLGANKAVTQRRPISLKTLKHLRWTRRYGNWHGIAPEVVRFDDRH